MKKSVVAALVAAVVVVVAALVGVGAWAVFGRSGGVDDASVKGTCGTSSYVLTRKNGDDGLTVSFSLDGDAPGGLWAVTIAQGTREIYANKDSVDEDYEVRFESRADDTAGGDFTVRATDPYGDVCVATMFD